MVYVQRYLVNATYSHVQLHVLLAAVFNEPVCVVLFALEVHVAYKNQSIEACLLNYYFLNTRALITC
jgi:hypothetical protein